MIKMVDEDDVSRVVVNMGWGTDKPSTSDKMGISSSNRKVLIVSELGIYEAIFSSRKPEAKEFKRWVFEMLKTLRQTTGLEGFQVFRMMDTEHQKQAMDKLKNGLTTPITFNYVFANDLSNEVVSKKFGLRKQLKKGDMTPEMLVMRQTVLEDVVELLTVKEKHGLELDVSDTVYAKHSVPLRVRRVV